MAVHMRHHTSVFSSIIAMNNIFKVKKSTNLLDLDWSTWRMGTIDCLTIRTMPPDFTLEARALLLKKIRHLGISIKSMSSVFVSCTPVISKSVINDTNSEQFSFETRPQTFMLKNLRFTFAVNCVIFAFVLWLLERHFVSLVSPNCSHKWVKSLGFMFNSTPDRLVLSSE